MGFELAVHGVTVISGMARGIDASAHWGAVHAKGQTIAVLGCGADICYPRENINLYEAILEHGVIISEYPCQTPPTAWQFPMRNRIISGLAEGIRIKKGKSERNKKRFPIPYTLRKHFFCNLIALFSAELLKIIQ